MRLGEIPQGTFQKFVGGSFRVNLHGHAPQQILKVGFPKDMVEFSLPNERIQCCRHSFSVLFAEEVDTSPVLILLPIRYFGSYIIDSRPFDPLGK